MKISYIVIGAFGFLVFISFVIACVGIEIQFGKRIEQKGPKMVIPDWIDVYKRQVEICRKRGMLLCVSLCTDSLDYGGYDGDAADHVCCVPWAISQGLRPVSYTHLDVYKRQI